LIEIKGKGTLRTYLLIGPKDETRPVAVPVSREAVPGPDLPILGSDQPTRGG
jgi:hypothetical protein